MLHRQGIIHIIFRIIVIQIKNFTSQKIGDRCRMSQDYQTLHPILWPSTMVDQIHGMVTFMHKQREHRGKTWAGKQCRREYTWLWVGVSQYYTQLQVTRYFVFETPTQPFISFPTKGIPTRKICRKTHFLLDEFNFVY